MSETVNQVIARVKKRGERIREQRDVGGETPVQQAPRDVVNINSIVARYAATRDENLIKQRDAIYGDETGITYDYGLELGHVLDMIEVQQERFMELDANIRKAADNDLPTFLEMLKSEEGLEKLEANGLRVEGRDSSAKDFSTLKTETQQAEQASQSEPPSQADSEPQTPEAS